MFSGTEIKTSRTTGFFAVPLCLAGFVIVVLSAVVAFNNISYISALSIYLVGIFILIGVWIGSRFSKSEFKPIRTMLETLVFTLVFGAAFLGMGLNFNLGADGLSWITLAWQPWHVVLWGLVVQIAVAIDFIKLWITRRKELVL